MAILGARAQGQQAAALWRRGPRFGWAPLEMAFAVIHRIIECYPAQAVLFLFIAQYYNVYSSLDPSRLTSTASAPLLITVAPLGGKV